jgi:hypothetical protein
VGSCFALKRVGGQRTPMLAFTVFVREKVSSASLGAHQRIPNTVRRHGVDLPTDVVVVKDLRNEFGFAIDDGVQLGTTGAFAAKSNSLYAVTCAHCITGPDGNYNTPDPVRIEFPSRGFIVPLGTSADAVVNQGSGLYPDFGEMDIGLVQVADPPVIAYIGTRPTLPSFQPPPNLGLEEIRGILLNTPVQGWGARTNNIIRGQVEGVFVNYPPRFFDLMISDPAGQGLTMPGDSGLMWIGPMGQAYGIHMVGEDDGTGNPSQNTFACFAFRAASHFSLSLLST